MAESWKDKLLRSNLTDDDVLALLNWQLSLPAAEMDCQLIRECDLYLSGNEPGMDPTRKQALLDALLRQIDGRPRRRPKPAPHHRSRKRMIAVLLALLLLALAVGGVSYSIRRGVLNFNEDWSWGAILHHGDGAESLVVSGPLAHVELEHVNIDVLEAVTDGADLRVVYSVTNRAGEDVLAEPGSDYSDVPGAAEDGVHMCDYLQIDGQDAYFDDAFQAPSDTPGQIIYYLQSNLLSWGVDISGRKTITISLPIFNQVGSGTREGFVEFTIPATLAEGMVRGAVLEEANMGGHAVTITKAVFSPINGFVSIHIDGLTKETFLREFTTMGDVYGPDDYALDGAHLYGMQQSDPDQSGLNPGLDVAFVMRLPPEGWPDTLVLALERNDYQPDWEAVIRLTEPGES